MLDRLARSAGLNITAEGDAAPSLPTRRTSRRRPRETGPASEETIETKETDHA
jgi:hypothetical protein